MSFGVNNYMPMCPCQNCPIMQQGQLMSPQPVSPYMMMYYPCQQPYMNVPMGEETEDKEMEENEDMYRQPPPFGPRPFYGPFPGPFPGPRPFFGPPFYGPGPFFGPPAFFGPRPFYGPSPFVGGTVPFLTGLTLGGLLF